MIGNPPWINYNQTADILRTELQNLSRDRYGIWAGGRYATHQDVAGLFFARSVDLYPQGRRRHRLRPAPQRVAGRAILQVAQRTMALWKLRPERSGGLHPQAVLEPGAVGTQQLLPGACLGGLRPQMPAGRRGQIPGRFGGAVARRGRRRGRARESSDITDTGVAGDSPYAELSRNGATIFPKVLFFVNETANHRHRAGGADRHRQPPAGQARTRRPGKTWT